MYITIKQTITFNPIFINTPQNSKFSIVIRLTNNAAIQDNRNTIVVGIKTLTQYDSIENFIMFFISKRRTN